MTREEEFFQHAMIILCMVAISVQGYVISKINNEIDTLKERISNLERERNETTE